MKILKNLALSLLSFLLFLSLSVFGIVYTVNSTALNPDFVNEQVNSLDVTALVEDTIEVDASGDMAVVYDEIESALPDIEIVVKENLNSVIYAGYDYILGNTVAPEIKETIRESFMSPEFVEAVIDTLDFPKIVKNAVPQDMSDDAFSKGFVNALVNTINENEEDIKQKLSDASGPIFDYLLGRSATIDLASTLREVVFTDEFTLALVDNIAVLSLASDSLGGELTDQIPADMGFLVDQIDDLLPELSDAISEQISSNIDQLLDYLLGQRDDLDITISLQDTVATLGNSLRENLRDVPPDALQPLFKEVLNEQIVALVPAELDSYIETAITDEWLEEQTAQAIDPALAYMLDDTPGFSFMVSLEPLLDNVEEAAREEFYDNPPAQLAGMPQSVLEEQFNTYYQNLINGVPTSIEIDETMLGNDLPAQIDTLFDDLSTMMPTSFNIGDVMAESIPAGQITGALDDIETNLAEVRQTIDDNVVEIESALEQAREVVSYIQMGYTILIISIAVIVILIILLIRNVKGITRYLGVPLMVFGGVELAISLVGETLVDRFAPMGDIPPYLQTWMMGLVEGVMNPLLIVSIVMLAAGVILTVISFVYKRGEPVTED